MTWVLFAWVAGCCCAYIGLCMFLLALWDRSRKVARPAPIELATRFRVNDAFEDIINRYEE